MATRCIVPCARSHRPRTHGRSVYAVLNDSECWTAEWECLSPDPTFKRGQSSRRGSILQS
ncbi:hypothetical protein C8Q76DRAFT_702174 [Earliella scabrosa]|nr:hypothetical protein C8Q76DRAFT_702174 [Earliella scabrosa]